MTVLVAGVLTVLALVDGALAGFRSSLGRTGLVRHRAEDLVGARRGLATVVLTLLPAVALCTVRAARSGTDDLTRAGAGVLLVVLPYGAVVVLAIGVYLLLAWEQRYLASAVILGPFTLARPFVVVGAGVLGVVRSDDGVTVLVVVLAVVGVLAVEPLCNIRATRS